MFRIETITGNIQSVSSVPTHVPRHLYEQFVIYKNGSSERFYWFDTTNNEWNYSELTTIAEEGQTALTGDVTLSEGSNITLVQSGQDIEISSSYTDQDGIYIEIEAGENISQHNAVCLGGGSDSGLTQSQETGSTEITIEETTDGSVNTYNKAQVFTTNALGGKVMQVALYVRDVVGDTWTVGICNVDGSNLPNLSSILQTQSQTVSTASLSWETFTFSSPVALSANTKYAIIVKRPVSGTGGFWVYDTSDNYAGGNYASRATGGTTWTADTGKDFLFRLYETQGSDSKVYKCDASFDTSVANAFIGFARASATSGNLCSIQCGDLYTNPAGLSNLTLGDYYVSDTAGSISSTAGTVSRKVGVAVSATKLLIKHDNS